MAKERDINVKKIAKRLSYNDIIKDDNKLIREISVDVSFPLNKDDKETMHQMIDYVRSSQNEELAKKNNLKPAYGISAIQIGRNRKLIFIRIESEFGGIPEEFALINPKVIEKSTTKAYLADGEGCLSVENLHKGYVLRPYAIKIQATDFFTSREVEIEAKGLTAIVLQHEMDHLLGILYYDRINKLDPFKVEPKSIKIS